MKEAYIDFISKNNSPKNGIIIANVESYVEKLLNNAIILNYYETTLKGLIAFYANDISNENAFLTLILVDSDSKGKKIGFNLLNTSINFLKNRKFRYYNLEVLKSNISAIDFYEKIGFKIEKEREDFFQMKLLL
jgi:ribosomal protein S18 acetylase RimI-like enzyme